MSLHQGLNDLNAIVERGCRRGRVPESSFKSPTTAGEAARDVERFLKGDLRSPVYARFGHPNAWDLEDAFRLLEGGAPVGIVRVTSCGMAAVRAAILGSVKSGDHLIASRHLFGSTIAFLQQLNDCFGVEVTTIDGHRTDEWRLALRDNTRAFFFESPSNPLLHIVDMDTVAGIAHQDGRDIVVIVDNSVTSPLGQKPVDHGADIVCTSLTKYFSGGQFNGGCLTISKDGMARLQRLDPLRNRPEISKFRVLDQLLGGDVLSPANALHFMEQLRQNGEWFAHQCRAARVLAEDLIHEGFPVLYPGQATHPQYDSARRQMVRDPEGGLLAGAVFSVDFGSAERAFQVVDSLCARGWNPSSNFGQPTPFATHQASVTYASLTQEHRMRLGITDGFVRFSTGWNDIEEMRSAVSEAVRKK